MARKPEPRPRRFNRISRQLAKRYAKLRPLRRPLTRRETKPREYPLVAYDLETTRIGEGTPTPLYLTAYGESVYVAKVIESYDHLAELLAQHFLTEENNRARFVAWNGNHFDAYFIARALLTRPEFELKPYFAKGNKLRGLMVRDPVTKRSWEFLDGIAMTGVQLSLRDFLDRFAPDFAKLKAPDFAGGEEFDAKNPEHRKYAIRDSEGLYHGITRAQAIIRETFQLPLSPTIGATGIRIFQRNMPEGVDCWQPSLECLGLIRTVVYRGGYCVAMGKHRGPVWKYDVNQAYAAAMREDDLPAGNVVHSTRRPKYSRVWMARVSATRWAGKVPFFYRDLEGVPMWSSDAIGDTWLTNVEIEQLEREGWKLAFHGEFWVWDGHFRMVDFVDKLEALRSSCEGGPVGAIGTMIKAVGNNAYGKTAENLDAIEIRLAKECPEGFAPYDDVDEELPCAWFRLTQPQLREYHQPQIAAWITASVRMKIRRAALLAPDAFKYADTDCVVFTRSVQLPIDRVKYGLWKLESDGVRSIIVDKKVYCTEDGATRHAKGLNVERLDVPDFIRWHEGEPPKQDQLQRKNWLRFLLGEPMFAQVSKVGQIISAGAPAKAGGAKAPP